jgi:uncharacterized membrane protein
MIGLSILFSTSLRGWFITGHDIHHEFRVFQTTSSNSLWPVRTQSGDPYNSCLSITILPTIITKITTISAMYVYKFIFQIIFAFSLIPVYFFIKKISNERKALIGSFLFVSFPTFINDMPFLNRQEIAFVFFNLLILTNFLKIKRRPKIILTIVFLIGIIISHYSSSYAMIGVLVPSLIIYKLISRQKTKKTLFLPLMSLPILGIAIFLTFLWNSQITASTAGLNKTVIQTITDIKNHSFNRSGFTKYSLFPNLKESNQKTFEDYADSKNSDAQYVPLQNIPLTNLGKSLSRFINVEKLNNNTHTLIAKIYQILLIGGVVIYFFKRNKKVQKKTYLLALSISCILFLVLLTLLPQLSIDYTITRFFQQVLIIIAIPIILASEFLLSVFGRFKTYATAILFVLLFAHLSGFIPQIIGGYQPQISLNNSGPYYDFFYTQNSDILATKWLDTNRDKNLSIFIDSVAALPDIKFPIQTNLIHSQKPVLTEMDSAYLYEDHFNVDRNIYRITLDNDLIEYSDPSQEINRTLIYSNGKSSIYGKRQ